MIGYSSKSPRIATFWLLASEIVFSGYVIICAVSYRALLVLAVAPAAIVPSRMSSKRLIDVSIEDSTLAHWLSVPVLYINTELVPDLINVCADLGKCLRALDVADTNVCADCGIN